MGRINPLVRNIANALENSSEAAVKLSYLTPTTGTPSTGQFKSSVINRAKMVDLEHDLAARFGINRHYIQQAMILHNETGPNGEQVAKPVNDIFDQVRIVGRAVHNQIANFDFGPHV